ncbi:rifamycin-inactivating phosphotransferase [Nakamurella multipartita]|uniref:Rifampicin phosphotransferase n=1 Tax=Nakamurella multipartita (strain ATCC 700099 / DSM 44233 / CIP 104796 / JCM 9543 / NBRC 105858 / Y-104) TaxID=479431 RepID=C8X859_NAKMY|nr:rifamycin-inactivating phosphotransferase [Nakamurella multipartita]ACV77035.1 pyruvate phosphate dikinase PEP/pyruvate- binding [Nakamurella multipartita DSM 44233]
MREQWVVGLDEVDQGWAALVGGKGANLGELMRIDGVEVPDGFCVTTTAFRQVLEREPWIDGWLDRLAGLDPADRAAIGPLTAEIRRRIENIVLPADLAAAIEAAVAALGVQAAYAVRSSATAEDLPTASFAGQQDSFLDVVGAASIERHLVRCWASLFTERAVAYRQRRAIDHRAVRMAVVVQRMVPARAAGVMFTADPITGNRRIVCVEAAAGLGEALVAGRVNGEVYRLRDGQIVDRTVSSVGPVLTDDQVRRLAEWGRRIEAHFGRPQDIEWCLADNEFQFVQSRPITTLFPIPPADDEDNHVYLSVGHQQMMTEAMRPLGLSFWQMTTPAPMAEAGGRLFVDVTRRVGTPAGRAAMLAAIGRSDPLTGDALRSVLERDGFIPLRPDDAAPEPLPGGEVPMLDPDPGLVTELIARTQASIATAEREIQPFTGPELLDFIQADLQELRRILFDRQSHQAFMTAMQAAWWLNEHGQNWLGEKNVADILTQSVPHNVTSEMGLALLDVADAIRPHPAVIALLETSPAGDVLDRLTAVPGGGPARAAIVEWLDRYGMRCVGEIDITRPRWSEQPGALVPVILSNLKNFEPGEAARRVERGRQAARAKEQQVLERVRVRPGGAAAAEEMKLMIDRVRTFIGYREYPKYGMVSRYFVYKEALLREADRLTRAGVLAEPADVFFLTFPELQTVARTGSVDRALLDRRRSEFESYQTLTPPRVLTSDGEAVTGRYRRDDVPAGALAGLPVSAGTVEGRARVVLDMADADLDPGDILITTATDPSWTPLFVTIAGLITEVGGLMTHGAVIAREYGLPAVVGVVDATRLITDGQRIRVNGTDGWVQVLS